MSNAWRSYKGAPDLGSRVCALDDISDHDTLCLELAGFPILLVRHGRCVRAFVNACPHQFLPLDHKGDKLLSTDGSVLRCTNHSAGFCADTGKGVEGYGTGECLDVIPVTVAADGSVIIG